MIPLGCDGLGVRNNEDTFRSSARGIGAENLHCTGYSGAMRNATPAISLSATRLFDADDPPRYGAWLKLMARRERSGFFERLGSRELRAPFLAEGIRPRQGVSCSGRTDRGNRGRAVVGHRALAAGRRY